jgi:hypothetical protein
MLVCTKYFYYVTHIRGVAAYALLAVSQEVHTLCKVIGYEASDFLTWALCCHQKPAKRVIRTMPSGFAVLGAISASWGFAKDIVSICKRYHDSKTEIPAVLLRLENDTVLLGCLDKFFTEDVLQNLDDESVDHLQRVFSYLLPILQSTTTRLLKYKSNTTWDRTKWITVGDDLKSAESALYEWVDRLQKCLVLLPHPTKSQLLTYIGQSSSLVGTAMAQQRMEERILEWQKLARSGTGDLGEDLLLQDGFGQDFEPWSGGRFSTIGSTKYLVEWKRLPASDSGVDRIRREAQQEIVKLVSVLSDIDAAKMFSLRAVKYFVSQVEPTVPFGIVYELPTRFDTPVQLSKLLGTTDDQGSRILQHSLDQRFQLGRQIASAILFIHSIGWVHKGVQTSNIWMANRQSSSLAYPECLGTAFLAGFDYTRRVEGRSTGDETVGGGWLRQLYQHPDRVQKDSDEQEYLPEHDIYALGVILVEIGRWKPLATYKHLFEHNSAAECKRNLEVMADRLKITMGRRYVDVALRCLRILDGQRASIREGPAIRNILFDLEDLSTATA